MNKIINIKENRGMALILALLLMSLILFMSFYVLNSALIEDRIAKSQSWGAKTYYLAEAGIQEMVWKLKNDSAYKQNFETDPSWTTTFSRNNPFGADNGSYTVTIANSGLAHGVITSTGTIDIGPDKTSQRIVKTYVYRALGQSNLANTSGYADGNIEITYSLVNFVGGNAHSNNIFNVKGISTINVDNDLNVVNQYIKSALSTVNVGGEIHSANNPPAADEIAMPAIDFDSDDANSLKNRATAVYTANAFKDLMDDNENLILPGPITYVDGDIDFPCNHNLVVNGLLVSSRDINIGNFSLGCFLSGGNNDITVNHTAGVASGLLAKRKINFNPLLGQAKIDGAVYANDQLNIVSLPSNFNITGGLIARKLFITSVWQPLNIVCDNQILTETLGPTDFSPVITVEHWEEEY